MYLYSGAILVLSLVAAPVFFFNKRGRVRLRERWGCGAPLPSRCVWVHGASVGEVVGLLPLIKRLREQLPGCPVLLTCTSATGLDRGALDADILRLLPFDSPALYRRLIGNTDVELLITAETELWPGLLHFASSENISSVCVNAVISDFTERRYKRLAFLLKPLLNQIDVCCADRQSAARFAALGVPVEAIVVTGSAKYDSAAGDISEADPVLESYGSNKERKCFVLGSVRDGEESDLAPIISQLLDGWKNLSVIIAPRYLEKTGILKTALDDAGVEYGLYSAGETGMRCLVLDVMGKLSSAYAQATMAFVGGSLRTGSGGHNPLEPAHFAVPVVMGSHYEKQKIPVGYLLDEQAIAIVDSAEEVRQWCVGLLKDPSEVVTMGLRAQKAFHRATGATDRIMKVITEVLNRKMEQEGVAGMLPE